MPRYGTAVEVSSLAWILWYLHACTRRHTAHRTLHTAHCIIFFAQANFTRSNISLDMDEEIEPSAGDAARCPCPGSDHGIDLDVRGTPVSLDSLERNASDRSSTSSLAPGTRASSSLEGENAKHLEPQPKKPRLKTAASSDGIDKTPWSYDEVGKFFYITSQPELQLPYDVFTKLYVYQREGVAWMVDLFRQQKGGILADDMGLGKTVQSLYYVGMLMKAGRIRNALVVAPVSPGRFWFCWVWFDFVRFCFGHYCTLATVLLFPTHPTFTHSLFAHMCRFCFQIFYFLFFSGCLQYSIGKKKQSCGCLRYSLTFRLTWY